MNCANPYTIEVETSAAAQVAAIGNSGNNTTKTSFPVNFCALLNHNLGSNTNSFKDFIDSEVAKVKKILKSHLNKIDDKITKIKLNEAISHTESSTRGSFVKDSHVVALMRYYELIKELDNVHQNK